MRQRPWLWILLSIVVVFALFIGFIFVIAYYGVKSAGTQYANGNIALIHIDGVITSAKGSGSLWSAGGSGSEGLIKTLERVNQNPNFKAVVLRVNSPGGTAGGAQEVYEKLMKIRKGAGKKIVVSMGDVAASGAYYISSAADKIYAEPATLTGSIGVIAELMNLKGLYGKIGVAPETLKSGRLKDIGNSARPLTLEERKIFQTILDETHDEFISDVAAGRKLPKDYVTKLADGRVYTGTQALNLHLIDKLGNLEDAEQEAGKLAGIEGKLKIVDLDRRSLVEQLVGDSGPTSEQSFLRQWLVEEPLKQILFLARVNPLQ